MDPSQQSTFALFLSQSRVLLSHSLDNLLAVEALRKTKQ
jgi:hypothetical protein